MNIFATDVDPTKSAQDHCDNHVVKMVLESTQLLNNLYYGSSKQLNAVYKFTHLDHPCTKWLKSSKLHFEWLTNHAQALCEQYRLRYLKTHKCQQVIAQIISDSEVFSFDMGNDFKLPKVVPDIYQVESPVDSYRSFIIDAKPFAKWNKGISKPYWYTYQNIKYNESMCYQRYGKREPLPALAYSRYFAGQD